jgi:hypothetical protein
VWVFTNFGYFSVAEQGGELVVRARVQKDLEKLREKYLPELGAIREYDGTDYEYRANVSKEAFGRALADIAKDIDYPKFKSSVREKQGVGRYNLYLSIWGILLNLAGRKYVD